MRRASFGLPSSVAERQLAASRRGLNHTSRSHTAASAAAAVGLNKKKSAAPMPDGFTSGENFDFGDGDDFFTEGLGEDTFADIITGPARTISEGSDASRNALASLIGVETNPPNWVKDHECTVCSNVSCGVQFSFFLRRHHCRLCGNIFCARCSSKRCKLPWLGHNHAVRVCTGCEGSADELLKRWEAAIASANIIATNGVSYEEGLPQ